jgi:hypothetical protein
VVDKKHRLSIERSRSLIKLVIIGITVDTYFSLIRVNLTFGQVNIGRSFLCLTVSCGIYSRIGIRSLLFHLGVHHLMANIFFGMGISVFYYLKIMISDR